MLVLLLSFYLPWGSSSANGMGSCSCNLSISDIVSYNKKLIDPKLETLKFDYKIENVENALNIL